MTGNEDPFQGRGESEPEGPIGLVVRIDAKACRVEIDGEVLSVPLAGKLFTKGNREKRPVAVGDRVLLSFDEHGEGRIEGRLPRWNRLARASAGEGRKEQVLVANVDQVLIVSSLRKPDFRPRIVDRILAGCEREGVPARLILNKSDLFRKDRSRTDREPFRDLDEITTFYDGLGVPCLVTSAETGEGLDALREILADRLSVFCGLSGVGKTSLLNRLEPGLGLRVRQVSKRHLEGRHTTTSAALFKLSFGGHVIDTPGIRNFGLFSLEPREAAGLFVEFRALLGGCAFDDCLHEHEPGCAVKEALKRGAIHELRYQSYLALLEEARGGRLR